MSPSRLAVSLVLTCFACGEPALREDTGPAPPIHALIGIPVPDGARPVSASGTGNSIEVSLTTVMSAEALSGFYRERLLAEGWDLRVDSRLPDGGVSLHAVRGERPVWVLIHPDGPAARFRVITGVRDTTAR